MAKEAIKRTGTAVTEAALRSVMPDLDDTLKSIRDELRAVREEVRSELRSFRNEFHAEIRALDAKTDGLRDEMIERFGTMLNTVNEVSHRVTRLDGRIEGHMEAMRLTLMSPAAARPSRKRTAG